MIGKAGGYSIRLKVEMWVGFMGEILVGDLFIAHFSHSSTNVRSVFS